MSTLGIIMPNMDRSSEYPAQPTAMGLAVAMFPSTWQRVLACLFGRPGRSFYATELMQLTGGVLAPCSANGPPCAKRLGDGKAHR